MLAASLVALGEHARAAGQLDRAAQCLEEIYGKTHPHALAAMALHADTLEASEQLQLSIRVWRKVRSSEIEPFCTTAKDRILHVERRLLTEGSFSGRQILKPLDPENPEKDEPRKSPGNSTQSEGENLTSTSDHETVGVDAGLQANPKSTPEPSNEADPTNDDDAHSEEGEAHEPLEEPESSEVRDRLPSNSESRMIGEEAEEGGASVEAPDQGSGAYEPEQTTSGAHAHDESVPAVGGAVECETPKSRGGTDDTAASNPFVSLGEFDLSDDESTPGGADDIDVDSAGAHAQHGDMYALGSGDTRTRGWSGTGGGGDGVGNDLDESFNAKALQGQLLSPAHEDDMDDASEAPPPPL